MKTRTWILLICALLALCIGLSLLTFGPKDAASHATITSQGVVNRVVSLHIDQEFEIESPTGTNTVTVKDGKIAVTAASCPDHYCMERGFCSSGSPIVCLPNRLVVEFSGELEIDSVVG